MIQLLEGKKGTTCPRDMKIHSDATIIKIARSGQDRCMGRRGLEETRPAGPRVPGEPAGRAAAEGDLL